MKKKILKFLLLLSWVSILTACATQPIPTESPQKLLEKKHQATDAEIQLGMNYLQTMDVRMAKQKLLKALTLMPDYPAAWYAMGYYFEVTGDTKKANEYYLHAIQLAPQSGDAQNNYGTFLCHSGKPKDAIAHFLLAAQDTQYLDTAAAYENAGLCALLIPDEAQAKHYFTKAITQSPRRATSLMSLAAIDKKQGLTIEANRLIQQCLQFNSPAVCQPS